MRHLLFGYIACLSLGCATRTVESEPYRVSLEDLKGHIARTSDDFHLPRYPALELTDDNLDGDSRIPMSIYRVPEGHELYGRRDWVIRVRNFFLVKRPILGLEHGVAHEICHAVLGHFDRRITRKQGEREAEQCAYTYLGEERYLIFMRSFLESVPEYRDDATLSTAELRRRIRARFGVELDEPARDSKE